MKKALWIIILVSAFVQLTRAQIPFFQHYRLLKRSESVHVNVIFQDKFGFMWYGTNQGLFRFDGNNLDRYDISDSLPDNHVTAIAEDSLGRIWTGHRNGKLAHIEKGKIVPFSSDEGLSSNEISDILFDRKGNLIMVCFPYG